MGFEQSELDKDQNLIEEEKKAFDSKLVDFTLKITLNRFIEKLRSDQPPERPYAHLSRILGHSWLQNVNDNSSATLTDETSVIILNALQQITSINIESRTRCYYHLVRSFKITRIEERREWIDVIFYPGASEDLLSWFRSTSIENAERILDKIVHQSNEHYEFPFSVEERIHWEKDFSFNKQICDDLVWPSKSGWVIDIFPALAYFFKVSVSSNYCKLSFLRFMCDVVFDNSTPSKTRNIGLKLFTTPEDGLLLFLSRGLDLLGQSSYDDKEFFLALWALNLMAGGTYNTLDSLGHCYVNDERYIRMVLGPALSTLMLNGDYKLASKISLDVLNNCPSVRSYYYDTNALLHLVHNEFIQLVSERSHERPVASILRSLCSPSWGSSDSPIVLYTADDSELILAAPKTSIAVKDENGITLENTFLPQCIVEYHVLPFLQTYGIVKGPQNCLFYPTITSSEDSQSLSKYYEDESLLRSVAEAMLAIMEQEPFKYIWKCLSSSFLINVLMDGDLNLFMPYVYRISQHPNVSRSSLVFILEVIAPKVGEFSEQSWQEFIDTILVPGAYFDLQEWMYGKTNEIRQLAQQRLFNQLHAVHKDMVNIRHSCIMSDPNDEIQSVFMRYWCDEYNKATFLHIGTSPSGSNEITPKRFAEVSALPYYKTSVNWNKIVGLFDLTPKDGLLFFSYARYDVTSICSVMKKAVELTQLQKVVELINLGFPLMDHDLKRDAGRSIHLIREKYFNAISDWSKLNPTLNAFASGIWFCYLCNSFTN